MQEQCVFLKDNETGNAIFMLSLKTERTIQIRNNVHLYCLDYKEAFHNLRRLNCKIRFIWEWYYNNAKYIVGTNRLHANIK